LLQLYRDASVAVVSARENRYAAGVQSLMEGMACGRPVVATATSGLTPYLDAQTVDGVKPGDVGQMRAAILAVLEQPAAAAEKAGRGRALALARHGMERYVDELARHLRSLARHPQDAPAALLTSAAD